MTVETTLILNLTRSHWPFSPKTLPCLLAGPFHLVAHTWTWLTPFKAPHHISSQFSLPQSGTMCVIDDEKTARHHSRLKGPLENNGCMTCVYETGQGFWWTSERADCSCGFGKTRATRAGWRLQKTRDCRYWEDCTTLDRLGCHIKLRKHHGD